MFITSPDNVRIAYDIQGTGPTLLLLPGFQEKRQIWHEVGYVERLSREFTVITMDRRGIGESDMPTTPDMYTVEKMLADINTVLDICNVDRFLIWGHSFGGSISTQLATRSERLMRAVIAGSFFGRVYNEKRVNEIVEGWENVLKAQQEGNLKSLDIDADEEAYIKQVNIPATVACWRALVLWPVIEPREVRCPALVYSGANDERVTKPLQERQQDIEAVGMQLLIFDDMDHEEEISKIEVVLPPVLAFLRKAAR
jgi:pimeloyl-ACP methyl ester carboxylesterase